MPDVGLEPPYVADTMYFLLLPPSGLSILHPVFLVPPPVYLASGWDRSRSWGA